MSRYQGDFRPGQVVRLAFNSTSPATGAPASLASGAVAVTKDGAVVTPSGGVTLAADAGSVVGLNTVVVDTGIDPTTFAVGHDFGLQLSAGSVGGVSVTGTVLGAFSVLNRATLPDASGRVLLQPAQAGVTIPTVTTLTNAPAAGDFTATMKASLNASTPAATVGSVTLAASQPLYPPAKAGDAMTLDLTQALPDSKAATVGGALAGGWAAGWGRVAKVLTALKVWGPGNGTATPTATFTLDDSDAPTSRTPQ